MPLHMKPGIAHLIDARTSRAVFPSSLRPGPDRPGQVIAPGPRAPRPAPARLRRVSPGWDGDRNAMQLAMQAGLRTRPQPVYGPDDERRANTTRARVSGARNRSPMTSTTTHAIPFSGIVPRGTR